MTSFKLFLVCSFVLLARPQDIWTFLQPLRPALVFSALALVAMVFGGHRKALSGALSMPESKRYLVLAAIMVVGVPFSYNRGAAFHGAFAYLTVNMLFFVLLVSQVTSLVRLKSLIWVICLSALTYSVFGGLLQMGGSGGGRFELAGSAFDPNDTAYVLISLFPLCIYFVRFNEGSIKKLIAVAAICSSIAFILLTGSRGGMLALGAVMAVILFSSIGGIGKGYKILVVLMLMASLVVFQDKIDIERYMTISDLSSDYNLTDEEGRVHIWKGAIGLAFANPITGVGVESFEYAWVIARDVAMADSLREKSVHNSFLQVGVEVGLIGFAIYMLIILKSMTCFFRMSRIRLNSELPDSAEMRTLGGLMVLGFMGLLSSGFFLSQGYSIFSTLYFGLAVVMHRIRSEAIDAGTNDVSSPGARADAFRS